MEQKELERIIGNHRHWLNRDCAGWETMRADLSGADLSNADLTGANLSGADLSNADLTGANLYRATLVKTDLSGAILIKANLFRADLSMANLSGADLSDADMSGAILAETNLTGAELDGTDLSGAKLTGANLDNADIYNAIFDRKEEIRKGIVLRKPIKGYKKTVEGVVLTAEIPVGAVVFSINGGKCRTNMATVIDTEGREALHSLHDHNFTYTPGQKIVIPDFDTRYNVECAPGFHFFRTKEEAVKYCY